MKIQLPLAAVTFLSLGAIGLFIGKSLSKDNIAFMDLPICSGPLSLDADFDFIRGHNALLTFKWDEAIESFQLAYLRDPKSAEIQANIGYAYEQNNNSYLAIEYYNRALVLNPKHRRARERLGMIYLLFNDLENSLIQLDALRRTCLLGCQEEDRLKNRIYNYLLLLNYE